MQHPSIRTLTGAQPTTRLDPATTALIAIDFQNEYFDGRMPIPDGLPALRQARRLIEAADRHAMPVFHVQNGVRGGLPAKPSGLCSLTIL